MGQTRGDVFQYYVNQIVNNDTQLFFLETPSRDVLIKLSSYSSLTHDPSALQRLTDEQKESIKKNPKLLQLIKKHNSLCYNLIAKFYRICLLKGTPAYKEYKKAKYKVYTKHKQL